MSNIVIFSRSLPMHGLGGMEVVAWDVAQALHNKGCTISIITTKAKDYEGFHVIDGIPIYFIENIRSGKYSRKWWSESKRIFDENFSKDCNIVFSVSSGAYGIIDYKNQYPGVSFHLQVHGSAWGEFVSKIKSRTMKGWLTSPKNLWWMLKDFKRYRKFDSVIAIGQQVYNDLSNLPYSLVYSVAKLNMIKNGIDTKLFYRGIPNNNIRERFDLGEKKIILTACRLHPQKGVANCLNAISEIKSRNDFVFLIVGEGSEYEKLKLMVEMKKINDKVKFLGALPRAILAQVEAESDVFLFLTDRIEGLPLNVLEAASTGLPIILSKHVKLFTSENIVLVEPRGYKLIAEEIEKKLNAPDCLKESYLPTEYTLDYTAERYKSLLESIKNVGGNR